MKKLFTLLFCSLLYVAVAHGEVTHSLSGTTLTISYSGSGSTEMEDYEDFSSGTKRRPTAWSNIKTLIIEEGVTTIGAYAFDDCLNLTSVTIPASVKVMKTAAFQGCSGVLEVHATTPNDWAGIEFQTRTATNGKVYCDSHPFGVSMSSYTHSFFFYGQDSETIDLVFRPGITTIKSYAFKNANKIENVYLPNSVASIGDYAFDCKIKRLYVNNTSTPTTGTDAFTFKTGSTYLYLPAGASASTSTGYKRKPWYDSGANGKGAKYIGYEGTDKSASSTGNSFGISKSKVHPTSGTVNGVKWNLGADGVMTFTGPGTITTSFSNSTGNDALYPWWRFCNLVDKVKIVGEVNGLSNALRYLNAVTEIIIEQTTIPTATHMANGTTANICGGSINQTDNVILSIKPSSLIDANTATLNDKPWNNAKVSVALSEPVVFSEEANPADLEMFDLISTYIEEPFTLELSRTLSNAYANTFCAPVDMNADLIATTFGAGTKVYSLTTSTFNQSANTLLLEFAEQTSIEAGNPYVIQPANTTVNPTIEGVEPASLVSAAGSVTTSNVTFYGTLTPRDVTEGEIANSSFIFLQANNTLAWAESGTLKGMRAYFILNDNVAENIKKARPIMRLGQTATAITIVGAEPQANKAQKIMLDGQLLIIRNGKTYNAMGMIVE